MPIKIVVPVSGGKDSQSCLKLALKEYDKSEIIGLFCDTQFEHPLTYKHIAWMSDFYGVHIETITAGSVAEKIRKYQRFPGGGARHCTDELKIVPSKKFYKAFAEEQGGFQVWYGMRANESRERAKRYENIVETDLYAPHDVLKKYPKYLEKLGVMFRLPILEWSENEVFDFLGNEANELYSHGFGRVGCFPCLASGDKWKEKAFQHDETGRNHYKLVQQLEDETGKSIWTSKGGAARNNRSQDDLFTGCAICAI